MAVEAWDDEYDSRGLGAHDRGPVRLILKDGVSITTRGYCCFRGLGETTYQVQMFTGAKLILDILIEALGALGGS